jgi:hypothetical protein
MIHVNIGKVFKIGKTQALLQGKDRRIQ